MYLFLIRHVLKWFMYYEFKHVGLVSEVVGGGTVKSKVCKKA